MTENNIESIPDVRTKAEKDTRPDWVKAVDRDPDIKQMDLEAQDDFENGRVHTKEEAIRLLDGQWAEKHDKRDQLF